MKRIIGKIILWAVLWCAPVLQMMAYEPRGGRLEHDGGSDFGSAFIFLILLAIGAIYAMLNRK